MNGSTFYGFGLFMSQQLCPAVIFLQPTVISRLASSISSLIIAIFTINIYQ
jgi:hypothetical protein